MKDIYMLCNAHIDPIWLWRRDEGVAATISTFRVAADFCEKYDGFIFNHNESVLYEWVEEYEPELFARIQKLVEEGKWRIMGGWYLQPDCVMPSGESFLRQIEVGNRFFKEKFGVKSVTAINMDPFGHNRGLVQILKKTGYEQYLFMRPYRIVPEQNFIWKGYDGSEVIGHCIMGEYRTLKGQVMNAIDEFYRADQKRGLMCWGIGNHGGGPSEEDWNTICRFAEEHPEVNMISSGCEEYFATVDKENLRVVEKSLAHCMVGCYTSMVRIKQKHRQLENELLLCEKMLAASGVSYDKNQLKEAEKALLFSQFHDSLPGTMIKTAEEDMLRLMEYGREIISRYCMKAFFKLSEGQAAGKRGEIPVLVYNPNPYWVEQEITVDFELEEQNRNENEVTMMRVRTQEGEYLPAQSLKEESTINLDWCKKVVFRAKLKPMSMNRFDCELYVEKLPSRPIDVCEENETHYLFENEKLKVAISKETGLVDCYQVDGTDYLKERSAQIRVYEDNEDPWRMQTDGFYHQIGAFTLTSKEEANQFNGYPDVSMENVRVVENGDVLLKVQAILKHENSYAVVTYTIPKRDSYLDIHVKMYSNDANRMYKLAFPTTLKESEFVGQMAFGREKMLQEEKEVFYQKWCALVKDDKGLAVLNQGTYGGSAKDGVLNISILRTPIYSAHPIDEKSISENDRNQLHIDMGEREFTYRLTTNMECLDTQAEIYNQQAYILSFFPSGAGELKDTLLELDNPELLITRYEPCDKGEFIIRIYNSSNKEQFGKLKVVSNEYIISLNPYEFETYCLSTEGLKKYSIY